MRQHSLSKRPPDFTCVAYALTPAFPPRGTLSWPSYGTAHIWYAELPHFQPDLQQHYSLLSPDEQQRAGQFSFDKDRDHFILRRGILRRLLSAYLGVQAQKLAFSTGENGKPVLPETTLRFNLSHSAGMAIYAFTQNGEIGVDVEAINPDFPCMSVAGNFFTPHETDLLAILSEAERLVTFFQWWTRKEAYLKATGKGLSTPLNEIDVSAIPGDAWFPISGGWVCRDLTLPPGFLGAVAIEGYERVRE